MKLKHFIITAMILLMIAVGFAYAIVDCFHGDLTPNWNRYSAEFSWENLHIFNIIIIEVSLWILLYPWFSFLTRKEVEPKDNHVFPLHVFWCNILDIEENDPSNRKFVFNMCVFMNIFTILIFIIYVIHYTYTYSTTPHSILVPDRYPVPTFLIFPVLWTAFCDIWTYIYYYGMNTPNEAIDSNS